MEEWAEGGEWAGHCYMMETRRDREISDRVGRGGMYLIPPFMPLTILSSGTERCIGSEVGSCPVDACICLDSR